MSKGKKSTSTGAMLDLWRPPPKAGEPVGCLTTTYTFTPSLFDEQCLARFLEIESEPNREDLAFLLERESRLGGIYAGVLVDHTQAGVAHSLRWDVLPVRIRGGKQHAKLSLLAWGFCVRVIIASANLTDPGYRSNYEVAAAVDLKPEEADTGILARALDFFRDLIPFVPGVAAGTPEVQRAEVFLNRVEQEVEGWKPVPKRRKIRQQLVCTLPAGGADQDQVGRSSLEEAVLECRKRSGSPHEAWVASPFFDGENNARRVTAALCKLMARGEKRKLSFCVPAVQNDSAAPPQLAAPVALLRTPTKYQGTVTIKMLPQADAQRNCRPWHAKMLALRTNATYFALMIGSSNFTCAGMGVGAQRNSEANLLTIVEHVQYSRDMSRIEGVWPEMEQVPEPKAAAWLGAQADQEEEERSSRQPLPGGFLSATYHAGSARKIVLRFDLVLLPEEWSIDVCGLEQFELIRAQSWIERGRPAIIEFCWKPVYPPEKLLVRWGEYDAFLPLNVEDSRNLPPPEQLEQMSADDMLAILAATDPSAAYRLWVHRQNPSDPFDAEGASATPTELDPLQRYDLRATFLHRIQCRARVLAQLRANLERPVWGRQALEWRLRGIVGIESVADRFAQAVTGGNGAADEALLVLADFLIVLSEVDYRPSPGAVSKTEFREIFHGFLRELACRLGEEVTSHRARVSEDIIRFWERVVDRCKE